MPEVKIYQNYDEDCECKPENTLGGVAAIGLCFAGLMTCTTLAIAGGVAIGALTFAKVASEVPKTTCRVTYNASLKKNN